MDEIESTAKALRGALVRYAALDSTSTARAAVSQQIFGVTASRRFLPCSTSWRTAFSRRRSDRLLSDVPPPALERCPCRPNAADAAQTWMRKFRRIGAYSSVVPDYPMAFN